MEKTIEIPEGYEVRIEGNKVILEPKESEDERVRKELIQYHTDGMKDSPWFTQTLRHKDVLAYLERQKYEYEVFEPIESTLEYKAGFRAGIESERQKEQLTDAQLERVVKAARRVLNNWLDGTDCPDVSGDFAELEYAIREYDGKEKQKEQKIAHWKPLGECSDIPDGHYVVGWFRFGDFRLGVMCNGLFVDPNGNRAEQPKEVFYIPNADEEFVYAEQKSVQDREEREYVRTLKSLIADFLRDKEDVNRGYYQDIYDWLDGRHIEQKPAEWSEEDEKNLKLAYDLLVNGVEADRRYPKLISWLKSLSPSWKPSEEQMDALKYALGEGGTFDKNALKSLFDDLKKI